MSTSDYGFKKVPGGYRVWIKVRPLDGLTQAWLTDVFPDREAAKIAALEHIAIQSLVRGL